MRNAAVLPVLIGLVFIPVLWAAAGDTDSIAATADDPFLWLEQVDSPRAMDWVRAENAKTAAVLDQDSRYPVLYKDALTIAQAQDRIPQPNIIGGQIYNFWQDAIVRCRIGMDLVNCRANEDLRRSLETF